MAVKDFVLPTAKTNILQQQETNFTGIQVQITYKLQRLLSRNRFLIFFFCEMRQQPKKKSRSQTRDFVAGKKGDKLKNSVFFLFLFRLQPVLINS